MKPTIILPEKNTVSKILLATMAIYVVIVVSMLHYKEIKKRERIAFMTGGYR